MTDVAPRILVVEDEYMLAAALSDELAALGVEVIGPVGELAPALTLIETTPIDGAILDINLRGEMVFPLADALTGRAVPFVFATGYGQENIPARFQAIAILPKPVDVRLLAPLLQRQP